MRRFLGEDGNNRSCIRESFPCFILRIMGVQVPGHRTSDAVLIPSVGCPMGCNFCSTSAFFGGKGKHLEFYRTGEELFEIIGGGGPATSRSFSSWTRTSCYKKAGL